MSIASSDITLPPIAPEIRQQAIAWWMTWQEEGEAAQAGIQQWQAAHPEHARAWQQISDFGARLQGLPPSLAHATLSAPGMTRRQIITAMAALMLAGGVWQMEKQQHWTADHRTGTGQRAKHRLPDGTQIELNAGTAVDVRYTADARVLRLLSGEILVTTAHDTQQPSRPFFVETAQGRIQALGTRFSVRDAQLSRDGHSRVAVFEGAVEIRPRASAAPLIIHAGEQGRFSQQAAEITGAADEISTAWVKGMIVAQDMPLGDFVAELARHRRGHLSCDAAAAHLRISGTYPLADTDRVLAMLKATQPVRLQSLGRYWIKLQPAHKN